MKRLLLLTITILLSNLFAQESDNRKPTRETIQSQIDSLKEVRVSLERKIVGIDSLLKVLEVKKAENEAEQFKMEGIVLTTKEWFGLPKLRPSPDISVAEIKVIPPGTKITGLDYRDDGYWRVDYNGTTGFLLDSHIVLNEATKKFLEAARLRGDKRQKELESAHEVRKASLEQKRRQTFVGQNKHISERFKKAILNGQIMLGMSKEMLIASWGQPSDINKSVGNYGVHEQWVYDYTHFQYFVYFENGVLTSWQE